MRETGGIAFNLGKGKIAEKTKGGAAGITDQSIKKVRQKQGKIETT